MQLSVVGSWRGSTHQATNLTLRATLPTSIPCTQIDATMERRICTAVLKQLDDNSNDVQTIAVKCLGALLRKVQEAQVCAASLELCACMRGNSDV